MSIIEDLGAEMEIMLSLVLSNDKKKFVESFNRARKLYFKLREDLSPNDIYDDLRRNGMDNVADVLEKINNSLTIH